VNDREDVQGGKYERQVSLLARVKLTTIGSLPRESKVNSCPPFILES